MTFDAQAIKLCAIWAERVYELPRSPAVAEWQAAFADAIITETGLCTMSPVDALTLSYLIPDALAAQLLRSVIAYQTVAGVLPQ